MARRVKKHYFKEATMTEPKPQKKRLVTLKEYLRNRATKVWLRSSGLVLIVSGVVVGVIFVLGQIWYALTEILKGTQDGVSIVIAGLLLACLFYMLAALLYDRGTWNWKRANQLEDVELLKHDNVGQLPAEDTLLRASTEPTQAQEKVLLRAATGAEETPPEQLLRADVAPTP
jgi:hypothetical protein